MTLTADQATNLTGPVSHCPTGCTTAHGDPHGPHHHLDSGNPDHPIPVRCDPATHQSANCIGAGAVLYLTDADWAVYGDAMDALAAAVERSDELARRAGSDLPVNPGITLADPPPATAAYSGSNPRRQGVGLPGHCEACAQYGHVIAHPDFGCGDVGCTDNH